MESKTHSAYSELITADSPQLAEGCKCEIGQTVGRVYPYKGGVLEFVGTRKEAEKFVEKTMKEFERAK